MSDRISVTERPHCSRDRVAPEESLSPQSRDVVNDVWQEYLGGSVELTLADEVTVQSDPLVDEEQVGTDRYTLNLNSTMSPSAIT